MKCLEKVKEESVIFRYFEDFANDCTYELGEDENGRKLHKLPENSRYIKSEEILYEIHLCLGF